MCTSSSKNVGQVTEKRENIPSKSPHFGKISESRDSKTTCTVSCEAARAILNGCTRTTYCLRLNPRVTLRLHYNRLKIRTGMEHLIRKQTILRISCGGRKTYLRILWRPFAAIVGIEPISKQRPCF